MYFCEKLLCEIEEEIIYEIEEDHVITALQTLWGPQYSKSGVVMTGEERSSECRCVVF